MWTAVGKREITDVILRGEIILDYPDGPNIIDKSPLKGKGLELEKETRGQKAEIREWIDYGLSRWKKDPRAKECNPLETQIDKEIDKEILP